MRWGTSHFVSRRAAVRYYASPYSKTTEEAERVVTRKLADGEIHIGKPDLQPGQRLSILPGEGRYQIEDDA